MREPVFPVLSIISIILVLLPSPWHFKTKNTGTLFYIGWTIIGNLIYCVNSLIWAGNLRNDIPHWCDLTTKLMIGLSVGLPATSLAINRRLYRIASVKQVNMSAGDVRRNMWIDIFLGFGVPVIVMILHVISQGHRYDILEDLGCWPSTYVTPVALATVWIWPIGIGIASAIYAGLSVMAFLKQRRQFDELLKSANSGLNISRYFRLMALASTEIAFSLPFSLYLFVGNVMNGLHEWISWDDTHARFNRAEFIPAGLFKLYPRLWIMVNVTRYALPACGIFFFLYFGMAGESGAFYKKCFWRAAGWFGLKPSPVVSPGASWAVRPGTSGAGNTATLPSINVTSSVSSVGKPTTSLDFACTKSPSSDSSSSVHDYDFSSMTEKDVAEDPVHDNSPSSSSPPHVVSTLPAHRAAEVDAHVV